MGAGPAESAARGAQDWYQQVLTALRPLDASLVGGLEAASRWQAGTERASALEESLGTDVTDLRKAVRNLAAQSPLPGHAGALTDYRAAVGLYLQAFLLEGTAARLAPSRLVRQLQRSFERIRLLGDATFDLGTTGLAPLLGSSIAGVDVQADRHLPDWSAQGLAPGQPLESSWTGTAREPSGTQSLSAWTAAAEATGPSPGTVGVQVDRRTTTAPELAGLALRLQQAEEHFDSVPPPSGAPGASVQLRLGLLIDAEAALAAEAGHVAGAAPSASLEQVAVSLVSIGNGLRVAGQAPPRAAGGGT